MRIFAWVAVWALMCLSLVGAASNAWAGPRVIASIVPVHALVSGVMDGVGTPELLLSGQTSEHQASFSPTQIKALGDADAVFFIGTGLELKLDELSGSDAVKGRAFTALGSVVGLTKYPVREGGVWVAHEHESEAEEEHEGEEVVDPHLWLDPGNAQIMAGAIAVELARLDPENAKLYARNAQEVAADLDKLAGEISDRLAGVKNQPFVVYHDAFQYFEKRFGLTGAGSIFDQSANAPGAQRLEAVREGAKQANAICAFREPQFSDRAVAVITEDTAMKTGVLDPIGADLKPGKNAYRILLENLASNLVSCLGN